MNPNVNAQLKEAHFFDEEHAYRKGLEAYNAMLPRRIPGKVGITWWLMTRKFYVKGLFLGHPCGKLAVHINMIWYIFIASEVSAINNELDINWT